LYDQLFAKQPGAICTVWHQDQVYLPIDTSDVIDEGRVGMARGWVSLTALPADVGGLHFVDGSHRLGPIDARDMQVGLPGSGDTAMVNGRELSITDYGAFDAGDATLHAGYTLHAARSNPSGRTRYGVAVVYVPDGARVAEPADEQQELAIALHTPGRRAGDPIDTPANPILWPAEAA
jgi:ectoine hydroxylase-related dioxygenase (phytanoyl-CoA dioxygenase family)